MAALTTALALGALGAAGTIGASAIGASAQTKASQNAIAAQQGMFNQSKAALQPFIDTGAEATKNITNAYNDPYFTKPIDMTTEGLEKTPGYQFIRDQGLKSVQNAYAARGLGSSGAAMKGASSYATGLAENTYKTIFDIESAQRNNIFSRFMSGAQLGGQAAGSLAGPAGQTGQGIANSATGIGNAQAGATMAAGNAFSNFANTAGGYLYMKPYLDASAAGGKNANGMNGWGGNILQGAGR